MSLWGGNYRTPSAPFSSGLTDGGFLHIVFVSKGVYHEERVGHFFIKIKMPFRGGCPLPAPHPRPWKKQKKKTIVLNQGSRCLYVFIYSDIYSVFCQAVCLPGCIPEILKTYMAKPQRSKTCVLWTLPSTLGQSLEWFILKELSQSGYQPHHVWRNVSDRAWRTRWRTRPNWGRFLSPPLSMGLFACSPPPAREFQSALWDASGLLCLPILLLKFLFFL